MIDRRADQELHALAGISISFLGAAALQALGTGNEAAALGSLSLAAAAGVAKELVDHFGFGVAEYGDFLYTVLGGIVGSGAAHFARTLLYPGSPRGDPTALFAQIGAACAVPVLAELLRHPLRGLLVRRRETGHTRN